MSPKYPDGQDKPYLAKRKKSALINIIVMSFFITPFLLTFIWTFIIEVFYPLFFELDFFFIIFGRFLTFIIMVPIGIFLLINSINYHKSRKMLKHKTFIHPRLDNSILQFLIENPGTKFTMGELLNDLNPEEGMEGLQISLNRLMKKKLISTEINDLTSYYFKSVKNLKRA